jgi:predicted acyl esterase
VSRTPRTVQLIAALMLSLLVAGTSARAADPPPGAVHSEHYFPLGDGVTTLHADVLRPAHLPADAPTPVVLTVSPYLNHAGATIEYGATATGPSDRFYDFLELAQILDRGYTYVMVDLPGFGGSGGCNDWGGPREQAGVKAAVEWAASQPWSTGRVAMIGKSYDAWTGLMAIAQQPQGLAAVVSMEPVFAGYRYLYNNGVRFLNSVATPALFSVIDAKPGSVQEDPRYNLNGAPQPHCYPLNIAQQQDDDADSAFWAARDLLRSTKGATTPLFLTQGFLERNTKPDGAFAFFNGLSGDEHRAWFGQFDHVRGWEKASGRFETGREVFIDELLRFLDEHLRAVEPAVEDPTVAVQDATGRYRAEAQWPPADAVVRWSELRTGTYADDGANRGTGSLGGRGLWTFSQSLPHDAWLAGEPVLEVEVDAALRANLVANVYDVAPDGRATLISRGTSLLRGVGVQQARFELYGQDWPLRAGHRIGVVVSGANSEWWTHVPTGTSVTVRSAKVGLPFLTFARDAFLDGTSTRRLEQHLSSAFVTATPAAITAGERPFDLPPPLAPRPAP